MVGALVQCAFGIYFHRDENSRLRKGQSVMIIVGRIRAQLRGPLRFVLCRQCATHRPQGPPIPDKPSGTPPGP